MKPVWHSGRRHFLKKMGRGLASFFGGAVLAPPRPIVSIDPVARIMSLSPDRGSARRVGQAVLATYGQRVNTTSVLRSVLGRNWRYVLTNADDDGLRWWLEATRREDFAAGRVVMFDGWILARSEIDFCILSTLV